MAALHQADVQPVAAVGLDGQEPAPRHRRRDIAQTAMPHSSSASADEDSRRGPGPRHPLQSEPWLRPSPGRSPWRCSCARTRSRWRRARWSARRPPPAAPQSIPAALTVRVMVAAMGLASTEVMVRAMSSSTQLNMKQKNERDADARADQRQEDAQEEAREAVAVDGRRLVDLRGTPDMKPSRIHTASGTLKSMCAIATAQVRVEQADALIELEEGQQEHGRRRHAVASAARRRGACPRRSW